MARSKADGRPLERGVLSALALLLAATAAAGAGLALAGAAPSWARLALAGAGLALLALAVALNGLLRLQGLGGEGLSAAAGVLGAALVLLVRGVSALLGALPSSQEGLFRGLELTGLFLIAVWLALAGWALRRLLPPAGLTGGAALVAAASAALLAVLAFARGSADSGAAPLLPALPFLPVALWALAVTGLAFLGRPAPEEPVE